MPARSATSICRIGVEAEGKEASSRILDEMLVPSTIEAPMLSCSISFAAAWTAAPRTSQRAAAKPVPKMKQARAGCQSRS